MKTTFIYGLKDPTTGLIRYVGKSDNPKKRLHRHLNGAKKGEACHRSDWLRFLQAKNQKPLIEIIDEVSEAEWQSWECAYIQFFKDEGCNLTNSTPGGEAGPSLPGELNPNFGKSISDERRVYLSEINSGEKHPKYGTKDSEETLERKRIGRSGKLHTLAAKEKIKAKRAVQVLTAERNAKISASMQGEKHHMFGKQHTEEAREKIKAARVLQTVNSRTSGRLPKNCKISIGVF